MNNKENKLSAFINKLMKPRTPEPDRDVIDADEYLALDSEEKKYWAPIPPKYERVSKIAIVVMFFCFFLFFDLALVCLFFCAIFFSFTIFYYGNTKPNKNLL